MGCYRALLQPNWQVTTDYWVDITLLSPLLSQAKRCNEHVITGILP